MKRIISIILVILICVGSCFMLTACSGVIAGKAVEAYNEYDRESKMEAAKSSFSAVMESYNGYITIKGECPLEIGSQTTIQQVMDAMEENGQKVTVEYIDTSRRFLDYCEVQPSGYYTIKDGITTEDWVGLYED